jgi:hypothetical protein
LKTPLLRLYSLPNTIMELVITPTQALVPLSILFVTYHAIRAWFSRKLESKMWDELPSVGVDKKQWGAWVWATLKSVRWTQDWAFDGYREVIAVSGFRSSLQHNDVLIVAKVCASEFSMDSSKH